MSKFKVGDTIGAIIPSQGFERATITKITNNRYYCKIPCGIAVIKTSVEDNYQLLNKKFKL